MIVYAVNVHTGGGKVLLDELLVNEPFGRVSGLFCDERYNVPAQIHDRFPIFRVQPKILTRLKAEFDLKKFWQNIDDKVPILFFGNLPPIFFNAPFSILYLQNCFLLPSVKIESHSLKAYLRLWVEKIILRFFIKNVSEIWVQSNWMVTEVKALPPYLKVLKKPFLPSMPSYIKSSKLYDFITVSSLSKHKKFDVFIKALEILDTLVKKPVHVLAILDSNDSFSMETAKFKNIKFEIRNAMTRNELFKNYENSKTAVVTSAFESFCLPVYEALHFGLKVIGPNEPYMKDITENLTLYENHTPEALAKKMLDNLGSTENV